MKLTKARIDGFKYEGRAFENGGMSRDIRWDDVVKGFGVRIFPSGKKVFVLSYRTAGRKRMYTVGEYGPWTLEQARAEAKGLIGQVSKGHDPLEERQSKRQAPTMHDLVNDYLERHAIPHKRPGSVRDDRAMLKSHVLPKLGTRKVADVRRRDLETLHQSLKATPYRANRVLALLSKMFSLAVQWEWRSDNPTAGIIRFPEQKRERWLSTDELARLTDALDEHPNLRAANAVRLLLLTGARRSEVLKAEWTHIDFERGVWTKPSHHTKQKKTEHVPLSAPALALLSEMRETDPDGVYLFPGDAKDSPLQEIKKAWHSICKEADIKDARLHDLRHTYASHLVSSGLSLPLIGRLLGHTQAAATQRYAHLADDPLREATNRFGKMVTRAGQNQSAKIVVLRD